MSGSPFEFDRLGLLDYLRESIKRLRVLAEREGGEASEKIRLLAVQIVNDVEILEAELIAAGYIQKSADPS